MIGHRLVSGSAADGKNVSHASVRGAAEWKYTSVKGRWHRPAYPAALFDGVGKVLHEDGNGVLRVVDAEGTVLGRGVETAE